LKQNYLFYEALLMRPFQRAQALRPYSMVCSCQEFSLGKVYLPARCLGDYGLPYQVQLAIISFSRGKTLLLNLDKVHSLFLVWVGYFR